MAQETITGRARSQPNNDSRGGQRHHHYKDSLKVFVSRIPVHFNEDSIQRLVQEALQEALQEATSTTRPNDDDADRSVVLAVELAYDKEKSSDGVNNGEQDQERSETKPSLNRANNDNEQQQQHKGYGFVVLKDTLLVQKALALGKLRGGAKVTSSRQNYTLYIGPCLTDAEKEEKQAAAAAGCGNNNTKVSNTNNNMQPCFLWTSSGNKHCPYGAACKFQHIGGRDESTSNDAAAAAADDEKKKKKKKIKCRDHRKNKCKLGDACPFSHDFEPKSKKQQKEKANHDDNDEEPKKREDSEKDCISWKTKGKCRKFHSGGDGSSTSLSSCPYRHDPQVQKAALDKIAERQRKRQNEHAEHQSDKVNSKRQKRQDAAKIKQPLSVRVFGMSYDTTLADVQRAFESCGKITKIDFPVFDDTSRRSKGYCGITFCTHKAVEKAVRELDGHEEKERWWRVQAGNMLLDQWE